MSDQNKNMELEITSLSDEDLETVVGGSEVHTSSGTCSTSHGATCSTSGGGICNTSGSGTCQSGIEEMD